MQKIASGIKKLLKHPLAKGSFIVFCGSFLANFFNYLFHLLTGRLMGPENYAIIASLISLFYVINFPSTIINTIVVRKVASLSVKNDLASVKMVFKYLLKRVFYLDLLILLFFFVFRFQIANFLKIRDSFLVFLLGLTFSFSLLSVVGLATMQGLLKFKSFSFLTSFISFLRDLATIMAIFLSFGVLGVMWGMVGTAFISFLLSIFLLRFIFRAKNIYKKFYFRTYFSMIWVIAALLGTSLMINSDVMLVKHFFPSYEAGLYAALSTMGKVIFFASSSVGIVLLPLATKKNEAGLSAKKELITSQVLVGLLSLILILIYFLFPRIVVNLFYGPKYFAISPYLGLIGIYFLFYNLSYLLANFYISLHQKKILLFPLFFACLQISLIFLFHRSFYQVLKVMIFTSSLLFLTFSVYSWRYVQRQA